MLSAPGISLSLAPRWLALAAVISLAGCASAPPRTAPFRARPDSVAAGDLRGPFSGRLIDAESGSAVSGALIYATWSIDRGDALAAPSGFEEYVTSSDAGGYYRIPALTKKLASGERLAGFQLVAYKRGYVAYRSDRRFDDFGPRLDFAQRENLVPMRRWQSHHSHARHLRYIGGGAALIALTSWEVGEAADELSGRGTIRTSLPLGGGRGVFLVAAQLLSEDDIKAVTKFDGSFETGPLGDEPDSAGYSSQHFKALGRAESFDIALRLWRLDAGAAQERYEELSTSLPGVEETNEVANRSLRASEGSIYGVAFLDGQRGIVALLTCGVEQCKSGDDAAALAQRIYDKIRALSPVGGAQ